MQVISFSLLLSVCNLNVSVWPTAKFWHFYLKTQRPYIQPSVAQTERYSPDLAEIAAEKKKKKQTTKLGNHKEVEIKLLTLVYILFIVQNTLFLYI